MSKGVVLSETVAMACKRAAREQQRAKRARPRASGMKVRGTHWSRPQDTVRVKKNYGLAGSAGPSWQ